MEIPSRWRAYSCSEYFREGWAERGHFDVASQLLVIVPVGEAYEVSEAAFFAVGRSGMGKVDFGYRQGHEGIWAYYPIEQDFKFMSRTIQELVDGWCGGRLCV